MTACDVGGGRRPSNARRTEQTSTNPKYFQFVWFCFDLFCKARERKKCRKRGRLFPFDRFGWFQKLICLKSGWFDVFWSSTLKGEGVEENRLYLCTEEEKMVRICSSGRDITLQSSCVDGDVWFGELFQIFLLFFPLGWTVWRTVFGGRLIFALNSDGQLDKSL